VVVNKGLFKETIKNQIDMREEFYKKPNLRQIKVKYLSATTYRGARVKIYEPKRFSSRKVESKIFSYCYKHDTGGIYQQAYDILMKNGFNVICRASEQDDVIFLCDNWNENFINIKDLK